MAWACWTCACACCCTRINSCCICAAGTPPPIGCPGIPGPPIGGGPPMPIGPGRPIGPIGPMRPGGGPLIPGGGIIIPGGGMPCRTYPPRGSPPRTGREPGEAPAADDGADGGALAGLLKATISRDGSFSRVGSRPRSLRSWSWVASRALLASSADRNSTNANPRALSFFARCTSINGPYLANSFSMAPCMVRWAPTGSRLTKRTRPQTASFTRRSAHASRSSCPSDPLGPSRPPIFTKAACAWAGSANSTNP